jgi:hypothetical protein
MKQSHELASPKRQFSPILVTLNDQNSFMILYKSIFEIILVVNLNVLKLILEHSELLKSDSCNPGIESSYRVK